LIDGPLLPYVLNLLVIQCEIQKSFEARFLICLWKICWKSFQQKLELFEFPRTHMSRGI
jgi:hypothetical protein